MPSISGYLSPLLLDTRPSTFSPLGLTLVSSKVAGVRSRDLLNSQVQCPARQSIPHAIIVYMCSRLEELFTKLDKLSWSFRVEKLQERGDSVIWRLYYVTPDCIWHEVTGPTLSEIVDETLSQISNW